MAPDEGYEFEFRENQEEARRLLSEHFQGALNLGSRAVLRPTLAWSVAGFGPWRCISPVKGHGQEL